MWKNIYFWLWIYQKGVDKSAQGNGKRPSVQDSNGEANLAITGTPGEHSFFKPTKERQFIKGRDKERKIMDWYGMVWHGMEKASQVKSRNE